MKKKVTAIKRKSSNKSFLPSHQIIAIQEKQISDANNTISKKNKEIESLRSMVQTLSKHIEAKYPAIAQSSEPGETSFFKKDNWWKIW